MSNKLLSLFFSIACLLVYGHAFFVQPRGATSLVLLLHPNQAADLEACAYDLMKQARAEQAKESNAKEAVPHKSPDSKERPTSFVQHIRGVYAKLKP